MRVYEREADKAVIQLLDRSVNEMTKQVVGIEVNRIEKNRVHSSGWSSFRIEIAGDYSAVLVMSAEDKVFRQFASHMKMDTDVTEADIAVYVTEYYNILCGFFVSHLNSRLKKRARFGIPEWLEGYYICSPDKPFEHIILSYQCQYGKLHFHGICLPLTA